MRIYLSFLILIITFVNVKAQESPRDEYTTFARFPANDGNFNNYIADHVKKPESIINDAKGIVAITVLIDSTGKVSTFKISKKISPEVDAEFSKAIAAAPVWMPAQLNGKSVQVYFTMHFGVDLNKATSTMTVNTDVDKVYTAVDVNPTFPGGEVAYNNFLKKTMVYPNLAKQNGTSGRVFISFTVETDGSLSDLKILRDPGNGLGDEALRILKNSPKWIPGIMKGKAVRVQYTVPINFNLYQ